MESYSAINTKIMPFAARWMKLEILILSEVSQKVSQKEKDRYNMISLLCGIQHIAQMNLSTEQKQSYRHGEQTCGCQEGEEEWDGLGVLG